MCVDKGLWTYIWIENDAARKSRREKLLVLRNSGRHVVYFSASLGQDGVMVGTLK